MKIGFYTKLAVSGIVKNKKTYLPYLLTCAGMVMMYYILSYLSVDKSLKAIPGGEIIQMILILGTWVMAAFSVVFLFYTNSFLIRHRKKEFGLYNVLGMGKWNVSKILVRETVLLYLVSVAGGLLCGILFSKLGQLIMIRMLAAEAVYAFEVPLGSVRNTALLFAVIFLLILLNAVRQIHVAKPVELLRSGNVGEKPPRVRWLFAAAGAVLLVAAYRLALVVREPIEAVMWFFVAVLMVIAATYLLFIAGSVALCKILQKNKKYYYRTNHFVSVGSMSYRMKRNGAGLASICILCTMVLVMISSTACLYIGMEDSFRSRYPRDIVAETYGFGQDYAGQVRAVVADAAAAYGAEEKNVLHYRYLPVAGYLEGGEVLFDWNKISQALVDYGNVRQFYIVPVEDYNNLTGKEETLADGEALLYTTRSGYGGDTISLEGCGTFRIKKRVADFVDNGRDMVQMMSSIYLFVKNMDVVKSVDAVQKDIYGENASYARDCYGVDLNAPDSVQIQIADAVLEAVRDRQIANGAFPHVLVESPAKQRGGFYSLYGGLFFLGILLGTAFIVAAVLIMYYKQITEGYEDQERFDILKKVGMTDREIRKSINSQMLTVFFVPLLTAGIHVSVAFKLISKLLVLFNLYNTGLLMAVTAGCFLLFALFYVFVYRMTSRAYYHIVGGGGQKG